MKTLTFSSECGLHLSDQLDVLGDLAAMGLISGWEALPSGSFLLRGLNEECMEDYLEDVGDDLFTVA